MKTTILFGTILLCVSVLFAAGKLKQDGFTVKDTCLRVYLDVIPSKN